MEGLAGYTNSKQLVYFFYSTSILCREEHCGGVVAGGVVAHKNGITLGTCCYEWETNERLSVAG